MGENRSGLIKKLLKRIGKNGIISSYLKEFNRQAVSIISQHNFTPTELSKQNPICESKPESSIFVNGNTATDALKTMVREDY